MFWNSCLNLDFEVTGLVVLSLVLLSLSNFDHLELDSFPLLCSASYLWDLKCSNTADHSRQLHTLSCALDRVFQHQFGLFECCNYNTLRFFAECQLQQLFLHCQYYH